MISIISDKEPQSQLVADLEMAEKFLKRLIGESDGIFTFQIIQENKTMLMKIPPQILNGTFAELKGELARHNQEGAGIFVTVNKTDGKGRRTENILHVRALFVDLDLNHAESATSFSINEGSEQDVLEALKAGKFLLKLERPADGRWAIKCPWAHQHSGEDTKGTYYFEPNSNGHYSHGFKCFHKHCESKNIHHLWDFLGFNGKVDVDPLPLYREVEQSKPYPFEALGNILGAVAQTLHRVIKAPDAVAAQSVLSAAALVAQAHANIRLDGRVYPLSIFFITIAESGDRKSATDKEALKVVYQWQKHLAADYREATHRFELQQESWELRKKEWTKENNKIEDFFEEAPPQIPLRPLLIAEEPTYEGIVKYFEAQGQPSIGLFTDEGGRFVGGHAMNRDNQLKTISGLSSIWDGKEISRMRSGDGDMLLFGQRLSMHLMLQEIVLNQLMGNQVFDLQGFLPRCLMAFPMSTAGNRSYVEKDLSIDPTIQNFNKALTRLLDRPLPVEKPPAPQNELKPRDLSLSPEAKNLWIQFHDSIDREIPKGQRLYAIRRFASKVPEHVLRMAGVLFLIEYPD
jgi:hypothetical protein